LEREFYEQSAIEWLLLSSTEHSLSLSLFQVASCEVQKSFPKPNITWYRNDIPLVPAQGCEWSSGCWMHQQNRVAFSCVFLFCAIIVALRENGALGKDKRNPEMTLHDFMFFLLFMLYV